VLLSDGRVLIVGGAVSSGRPGTTELYDPTSGRWTASGSLGVPRTVAGITLLDDGQVLVVGGDDSSTTALASTELYAVPAR
jgi:Galactose oxidase, central domain